jgi:hypothetical protein
VLIDVLHLLASAFGDFDVGIAVGFTSDVDAFLVESIRCRPVSTCNIFQKVDKYRVIGLIQCIGVDQWVVGYLLKG